MVKAVVDAVGNSAVIEQRRKHFLDRGAHLLQPHHVQEGLLLACKGGIREIFRRCRGTYRNRHVFVAILQGGERFLQGVLQDIRKWRFNDPLTDLGTNPGQFVDVVDVQSIESVVDTLFQSVSSEEFAIGVRCCGKATWNGNTCVGEITDHFAE